MTTTAWPESMDRKGVWIHRKISCHDQLKDQQKRRTSMIFQHDIFLMSFANVPQREDDLDLIITVFVSVLISVFPRVLAYVT
ncbi:MAG: hypothetical protein ACLR23_18735, partial [Clostridia bacterium]